MLVYVGACAHLQPRFLRSRSRTVPVTRKTPYLTLAALAVLFASMVGVEQAAASGDEGGDGHTSEYGHGAVIATSVRS
jgi:subtilase family serine protease